MFLHDRRSWWSRQISSLNKPLLSIYEVYFPNFRKHEIYFPKLSKIRDIAIVRYLCEILSPPSEDHVFCIYYFSILLMIAKTKSNILKTSYFPDSDLLSLDKVKKSRPPLKMMMPTMMTKIRLVRMMNIQETLHTLHTDLVFNFLLDSASALICCLAPWCSYNLYL